MKSACLVEFTMIIIVFTMVAIMLLVWKSNFFKNCAYKHPLGHHPSTFVVDDDDVEDDDDVVDEDDCEDDHEQDLCVSIPLSRLVKMMMMMLLWMMMMMMFKTTCVSAFRWAGWSRSFSSPSRSTHASNFQTAKFDFRYFYFCSWNIQVLRLEIWLWISQIDDAF